MEKDATKLNDLQLLVQWLARCYGWEECYCGLVDELPPSTGTQKSWFEVLLQADALNFALGHQAAFRRLTRGDRFRSGTLTHVGDYLGTGALAYRSRPSAGSLEGLAYRRPDHGRPQR